MTAPASNSASLAASSTPDTLRQPKVLYLLFATEAWERFSYYGMRALLVLYLTQQLSFARASALEVLGAYTGLVYVTPFFGGLLADRVLGQRKAVLIGGVLMALGHLAMAWSALLWIALGLLVVGNGFFKPNISTLVGGLYPPGDARRDAGFTIFYMGINLGALISPLACGALGRTLGWHYGFGAAGVGMVVGLAVFVVGQPYLGGAGLPPGRRLEGAPAVTRLSGSDFRDVAVWATLVALGVVGVVSAAQPALPWWVALPEIHRTAAMGVGGALLLGGTGWLLLRPPPFEPGSTSDSATMGRQDWERIVVLGVLALFVIVFWVGFEQAPGTMNLFAEEQTDRRLGRWIIPAAFFQSLNPLFVLLLAPIISQLWVRWDTGPRTGWLGRFRPLPTPAKLALGILVNGLSFVVLTAAVAAAASVRVSPLWLVAAYALQTVGELCLSPVGLSLVTKLAPARYVSLFMGLWMSASAIANYFAGRLEELLQRVHWPLYPALARASLVTGLLLMAITPVLRRGMHGRG